MNKLILEKLDWPVLLSQLADLTQTEQGRQRSLQLQPDKEISGIQQRWADVVPLRDLVRDGYHPPIGGLPMMHGIFRAIELGQILIGTDLRAIFELLNSVRHVKAFSDDFAERCKTLATVRGQLYALPKLAEEIQKSIGEDGEVLDEASSELKQIRRSKVAIRKKIESQITQLLTDQELETYLQDKFYTIRADRYVIPIRLDGRGRVKGSIHDTSSSGQTLFIEPEVIAPLNEQLRELELSEKLEVLRILRSLSAQAARELDTLVNNYDQVVELDCLVAEASLAYSMSAGTVKLSTTPTLRLVDARHPLVKDPDGGSAIGNDVALHDDQYTLIISGPNAGGKTVVLKTVAMLQLMAKSGLLLPADRESELFLFERIYLEMGDTQSLSDSLSTFSGHLQGLRPIVQHATAYDLVLLDELAVGTEPNTGAAIAQAILEHLADRKVHTFVTTHFDNLKVIATEDKRFRNGSMEFSLADLKPTYKLILDVPGQSYGLELAEQLGMPASIIVRSRELRGTTATALDHAVAELMHARDEARLERRRLLALQNDAEMAKANFDSSKEALANTRAQTAAKVEEKYEKKLAELSREFNEAIAELKETSKRARRGELSGEALQQDYRSVKGQAEQRFVNFREAVAELASHRPSIDLPGDVVELDALKVGDKVFIIPLAETGEVSRITHQSNDPVEVTAGSIRLRLPVAKLRKMTEGKDIVKPTRTRPPVGSLQKSSKSSNQPSYVISTPRNTIDLRGKEVLDAVPLVWTFIDKALLRGENAVIALHGHGSSDRLKLGIRHALETECPYKIRFRAGEPEEGGDALTVIFLE